MKHHLIIQLARFGDLVQTKRLVHSLSGAGNEVHLLVDGSLVQLGRLLYPQAKIHSIYAHGPGVHGNLGPVQVFEHNRKVMQLLADLKFSQVYNLNFSGLNHALSRLFAPEIVRGHGCRGRQPARSQWTDFGFRWARNRASWGINLVDYWAHLADSPLAPDKVNPSAIARGGGLGVVLAGRNSRRSLPPAILGNVAAVLWSSSGRKNITLLGSASERDAGRELASMLQPAMRDKVNNLAGKTDWKGLFEVVSGLDMLLTPDTGTMHLAAHLGTPVQAMFLSSAWCHETGPYGAGHTVWQVVRSCAPCLESQPCPYGVACLEPFGSREFLRVLGSCKYDQGVPGMVGLHSGFDALGATFVPFCGQDPLETDRHAFRAFLSSHLGLRRELEKVPQTLAETMYFERDWMARPFLGPLPQEGVHG